MVIATVGCVTLYPRVTYPSQPDQLYTFLLVEAETRTLHWMIINIPGSRLAAGIVRRFLQMWALALFLFSSNSVKCLTKLQCA